MNKYSECLFNGIIKENPTFVMMLGMCPTLAVTTSANNGLGMGLATASVLVLSNFLISLLRRIIPDKVRIPAFIVIVASFVTMIQLLIQAYLPALNASLGIYIPLIVVNCIILGRAEAYAYKNAPLLSVFDGLGMGLGFTIALTILGACRELIGAGTIFDKAIPFLSHYEPMTIMIMAPGAFFMLAMLTALQNKFKAPSATNTGSSKASLACNGNCASCIGSECKENRMTIETAREEKETAEKEKKAKEAQISAKTKQEGSEQ